jgi:hypothetical protein
MAATLENGREGHGQRRIKANGHGRRARRRGAARRLRDRWNNGAGARSAATSTAQSAAPPALRIEAVPDEVKVIGGGRTYFDTRLKEYLFAKDSGFTPGDALTIRYRFTKYNPGDQLQRWLAPYVAGKGEIQVEAVFLDKENRELAKIGVGSELSMGPLGGDFEGAISRAARELADYAIETF